jgi:hypothetical protein
MEAKEVLALIGGHVDEELLLRNEYLAAENWPSWNAQARLQGLCVTWDESGHGPTSHSGAEPMI